MITNHSLLCIPPGLNISSHDSVRLILKKLLTNCILILQFIPSIASGAQAMSCDLLHIVIISFFRL